MTVTVYGVWEQPEAATEWFLRFAADTHASTDKLLSVGRTLAQKWRDPRWGLDGFGPYCGRPIVCFARPYLHVPLGYGRPEARE